MRTFYLIMSLKIVMFTCCFSLTHETVSQTTLIHLNTFFDGVVYFKVKGLNLGLDESSLGPCFIIQKSHTVIRGEVWYLQELL